MLVMINEFRKKVLKLNQPRKYKIKDSLGVYDAYKWIRKNKWLNIGEPVTEHQFYYIVRNINNCLAENLLLGEDIVFPQRMGSLELRKYDAKISFNNNKLVTNLPIDWNRTINLWQEDEEAYKNKTLVKMEEKEIFKVYYNKKRANYNNKSFMRFHVNRSLKVKIKQRIKDGTLDAFKL